MQDSAPQPPARRVPPTICVSEGLPRSVREPSLVGGRAGPCPLLRADDGAWRFAERAIDLGNDFVVLFHRGTCR